MAYAKPISMLVLAAAAVLTPLASAQDYPKLKPGLWELKRSSDRPDDRGQSTTMCMDESLQREMYDMGRGAMSGMCSKHDFKITGSRGSGESVCSVNGSTCHSRFTMTINGDVAYRTEVETRVDPPTPNGSTLHSVIEARYTGPCKTGQRPGDMTLPNGQTINMRQALKGGRP